MASFGEKIVAGNPLSDKVLSPKSRENLVALLDETYKVGYIQGGIDTLENIINEKNKGK